ncbi:MAG TPA: CDGSH iron-sulfur domain-containing protein [Nitrospira sp.]|nr:CDGSH iron-sulfur domain-containing protein [Nitrospira sp.]
MTGHGKTDHCSQAAGGAHIGCGTYHWCRCGRSKNQPFRDGSHKGTGLTPLEFSLTETKQVALCQCKQTKNPPFCDGTHKTL